MTTKPHLKLPDIDPAKLPYSRNAILGIPDSGKTVTAKKMAEHMMTAGIPIVAFDPSGVWRFLRVPGKGRGFPVVVVGGAEPDLPMNDPRQAADIMRAVMASGVSVVFDLYDPRWSKEDWKRIVEAAVNVLWYENKPFGLRHLFLEEAAEFIPENFSSGDPHAGKLYATIEKIARMGRNAYLGMTLINQRAEGVKKAVLELCPNLMLHRQKGRNSLKNLSKWLEYIEGDIGTEIIESLPTLPTGQCWAWTESRVQPEHIRIPMLDSYHPNIAEALGETEIKASSRKAVNVEEFVTKLRAVLPQIEAEAKQNDPKALRSELAKANAELAKLRKAPSRPVDDGLSARATSEIARLAAEAGMQAIRDALDEAAAPARDALLQAVATATGQLSAAMQKAFDAQHAAIARALKSVRPVKNAVEYSKAIPAPRAPVVQRQESRISTAKMTGSSPAGRSEGELPGPQRRVLESVGFWKSVGNDAPTREQVAGVAGYSPTTGNYRAVVGALCSQGRLFIPATGRLSLSEGHSPRALSTSEARERLLSIFDGPRKRVVDAALAAPAELSRDELAAQSNYDPSTGNFRAIVGALCTLDILTKPSAGNVALSDWAREVLS